MIRSCMHFKGLKDWELAFHTSLFLLFTIFDLNDFTYTWNAGRILNHLQITKIIWKFCYKYCRQGYSSKIKCIWCRGICSPTDRLQNIIALKHSPTFSDIIGYRLASHMCGYTCFQIELSRGYDYEAFHEDLRKLYDMAGVQNLDTVFLFTDTQIVVEGTLRWWF